MGPLGFVGGLYARSHCREYVLHKSKQSWTCGQSVASSSRQNRRCFLDQPSRRSHKVSCFKSSDSGGDGQGRGGDRDDDDGLLGRDPNSDENDGYETIILKDPSTGRTLPCVIEHEVDVMEATYVVCCPQDDVVTFATERGDGDMICIEDEAKIDDLFPAAAAAMVEEHVALKRTAFLLTMDETDSDILGSRNRFDGYEDDLDDDDDDEDDDIEDVSDDDEEGTGELVSVVREFRHDNEDYFILKPEDPVLLVARRSNGDIVVVGEEELAYVSPIIEAQIEELALAKDS